jgi:uncharacterized protein YbaA (DUF1428 family)
MGTEIKEFGEGSVGSEIDHFIYRVPKKNHNAMMQINKQFADMVTKYGATHLVFQLNNTKTPMDGIVNIAKTIAADDDEEVWSELIFYRDRKHKEEIGTKMRNDESMGLLYQQSLDLVSPGTGFILGEFTRLMI